MAIIHDEAEAVEAAVAGYQQEKTKSVVMTKQQSEEVWNFLMDLS